MNSTIGAIASACGLVSKTSPVQQDLDTPDPLVLTFEQFAARNGASLLGIGDPGLHRSSNRKSPKTHHRQVQAQAQKDRELIVRRSNLRTEYEALVACGALRPPTTREQVITKANGHPDNDSVRAARRIAELRGWEWWRAADVSASKATGQPADSTV